ncbi:hypothetical protein L6452_07367 [Arctium lappa]|uniref:Uncharacterized protein n=1 Tax=Arctium lappa TaxID=4217 RepID=A0ACB9EKY4_ARCLA|nr:hypothetical protein L6452_07367 [Arctium lappa]
MSSSASMGSGSRTCRRTLEFGRTCVVRPKAKHQAIIFWLHNLGDNGSRYYTTQQLTEKSDAYSFRAVLLELICGREPLRQTRSPSTWVLWGKPERDMVKSLFKMTENGRPNSMIVKRAHRVIPAHIIAEAISTLHGIDLRWSGPITPAEMQYVEQYVVAKYPEYSNALVEGKDKTDLYELCVKEEPSEPSLGDEKRKSPRGVIRERPKATFTIS